MNDDLRNTGSPDRDRINVNEEHEVRYWTQRFGVSEDELRRAVEQVGHSVDEVEKRLRPN